MFEVFFVLFLLFFQSGIVNMFKYLLYRAQKQI